MHNDSTRRQLVGAACAMLLAPAAAFVAAYPKPRVIKVVAKKFEFIPDEIRVRNGETVLLQFTALEVPMGFNLVDFGLRADIVPGKETTLQLVPDKAGSFTFMCDVFCGSGHENMSGTLVVS